MQSHTATYFKWHCVKALLRNEGEKCLVENHEPAGILRLIFLKLTTSR